MTLNKNSTALSIAPQGAKSHGKQPQPQYCQITLADAIAHYKNRDVTAKGLLHIYCKIRGAMRWPIRKAPAEIYGELGMSRTTFIEALNKLKAEGAITCRTLPYSTRLEIRIISTDKSGLLTPGSEPDKVDGTDDKVDGVEDEIDGTDDKVDGVEDEIDGSDDKVDGIPTKKPLKPAPVKDSDKTPYSLLDSYQIFLKSLSEEERERFLSFQKKKAKKLPEYPSSKGWFANNYEHHAEEWRESEGKTAPAASQNQNWENHPCKEEWLAEIAAVGGSYIQFKRTSSTGEECDRKEFFKWIQQENLDWLISIAS